MMGHQKVEQAALFYEFSLERHVPINHLLQSIDRFVELGELRRELSAFYSTIGALLDCSRIDEPDATGRMLLWHLIGAALVSQKREGEESLCRTNPRGNVLRAPSSAS